MTDDVFYENDLVINLISNALGLQSKYFRLLLSFLGSGTGFIGFIQYYQAYIKTSFFWNRRMSKLW